MSWNSGLTPLRRVRQKGPTDETPVESSPGCYGCVPVESRACGRGGRRIASRLTGIVSPPAPEVHPILHIELVALPDRRPRVVHPALLQCPDDLLAELQGHDATAENGVVVTPELEDEPTDPWQIVEGGLQLR